MPFINPYIEQVLANEKIFSSPEKAYFFAGKWKDFFGNLHPIHLEIGTGQGNFFGDLCRNNPDINYIGLEIKRKRLANTFLKATESKNENFTIIKDFGQNIPNIFGDSEVSRTYIFFPDPWSKKDYQKKRRLLQPQFFEDLYNITKKSGYVYIKTDDTSYFSDILGGLNAKKWKILFCSDDYEKESLKFSKKNLTEFEAIWRGKKKNICYIELEKI